MEGKGEVYRITTDTCRQMQTRERHLGPAAVTRLRGWLAFAGPLELRATWKWLASWPSKGTHPEAVQAEGGKGQGVLSSQRSAQ